MISSSNLIYFDNNRTTIPDPEVVAEMELFTNMSETLLYNETPHYLTTAIKQIAQLINATPSELCFTKGTSESIATGIDLLYRNRKKGRKQIITSYTEHPAVLNACSRLQNNGAELIFIGVDREGVINIEELKDLMTINTALVCLMAANNETGVLSPIEQIAQLCRDNETLFFCDASQFVGKEYCDASEIQVDCLAFGSHKMYGPKGIGALYLNASTTNENLQEEFKTLRLTECLKVEPALAIGFGKAAEVAKRDYWDISAHISKLRNFFEHQLLDIDGLRINGSTRYRIYNTSNLLLPNPANILILKNKYDFLSNHNRESKTLLAMGLSSEESHSSCRFSFAKYNTLQELREICQDILSLYQQ